MKKIFILLTAAVLMFSTSCDDRLYLDPHQSISTSQAFETLTDFSYAVNGVYSGLRSGNLHGGYLAIYPDIMADNLTRSIEGRLTFTNLYNWNISTDFYLMEAVFDQAYSVIYRANKVITAAEEFETADDDEVAELNHYKGQALAIRGWMHFELVKMFGKAYSQGGASDLGVPYVTSVDAGFPSRETLTDTYTMIKEDLDAAYALMDPSFSSKDHLTQAGVASLQAKLAMEMGDYATVIAKGKEAVDAVPVETRDEVFGVWKDENKSGVLFYIGVEKKDGLTLGTNYSQSSSDGIKSEYVVSYELFQLFAAEDIRLSTYITTSDYLGNTYNHVEKFRGRSTAAEANPTPDLVDLKILRSADMALLVAEANMLNSSTNETEAKTYLKMVWENRMDTSLVAFDDALSGTDLLDEIYLQRRLELAFEGDRLYFLKRHGLPIQRTADGHLADGTGTGPDFLNLPANSDKMVLPIPKSEIDVNPNIRNQQNPGY